MLIFKVCFEHGKRRGLNFKRNYLGRAEREEGHCSDIVCVVIGCVMSTLSLERRRSSTGDAVGDLID